MGIFKRKYLDKWEFRDKNKSTAAKLCRFNKKNEIQLERKRMKLNYDRLESLIKESGKSKAYLCAKVNRGRYYMRDLKNANTNVPEETVEIWADELGTTPEYLTGASDEKEKPAVQKGDELSPEFASLFSRLTPEQKELVLATMRELAKGK